MPGIARARRLSLPVPGGAMAALDLGPPAQPVRIVFAHANGFTASTYADVLAPVAAAATRVVALDLRGHGRTELAADPSRLRSWAIHGRDVLAALAALDARDVVLAGHSLGAAAMILAAASAPDRVRSLVLFEPVATSRLARWAARLPGGRSLIRRRLSWARAADRRRAHWPDAQAAFVALQGRGAFAAWPAERLRAYLEDGLRPAQGGVALSCPPGWESANYAAQGADTRAALRRLRVPAQLWLGAHGSTWRPPPAAAPGRLEARVVEGAGHFLPFERPDIVQAALLAAAA